MLNEKIEKKIDSLLEKMTVHEKIGQLNQVMMPSTDDEKVFEALRNGEIGSLIMATSGYAGNGEKRLENSRLVNEMQRIAVEESRLGIPVIYGRDIIHGHNVVLPIPLAMASSFDPEQIEKCYRNVSKEAAADGVQWTFSPMLDVSRDPRWGRCIESPGEDPYIGEQMAKAVVHGFQGTDLSSAESMPACAKHFIGYSACEGGRDYHKAEISDYTLRNYYLKAFRAAVNAGVCTVMSSFNEISGYPVSSNKYLLTHVLKEELGFDGFVVSDWCSVVQLIKQGIAQDKKECAELSINAGIDMDMVDKNYIDFLEKSIEEGKVDISRLDDAVRRVLRVKFAAGLFSNPYIPNLKIDIEAHKNDERKLAADSMVLLKNNGVLPLNKDQKIQLAGPFATEKHSMMGSWVLDGIEEYVVSVLEGMRKKAGSNIMFAGENLLDWQYAQFNNSDVIVLSLGESSHLSGENNNLAHVELPDWQFDILKRAKKCKKPVVAVLSFGRPIALEEVEPYCDAILYTWHPGTMAGDAIADILYGDVVPNGKLPMTVLRCTGQAPLYYNAPSNGRCVDGYYNEGTNYHDCLPTPMYPFGYGLSYTTFEYGTVKSECSEMPLSDLENNRKFRFTFEVKNTGDCDGKETAMLFIRDRFASMTRPVRELKAFDKKEIKKGESVSFSFELGYEELAFYNSEGKFKVEPGLFEIFIGRDCYAPRVAEIYVK